MEKQRSVAKSRGSGRGLRTQEEGGGREPRDLLRPGTPLSGRAKVLRDVIENDKRPLGATAETFCEKGNKAKQNTYYQLNPRSFIRDPNHGRGCLTAAPLVIELKARMPFSSSPRGVGLGGTPTFLPVLLIEVIESTSHQFESKPSLAGCVWHFCKRTTAPEFLRNARFKLYI